MDISLSLDFLMDVWVSLMVVGMLNQLVPGGNNNNRTDIRSSVLTEILLSMNSLHQLFKVIHLEPVLAGGVPHLHLPAVLQTVAVGASDLSLRVGLLADLLVRDSVAEAVVPQQTHV